MGTKGKLFAGIIFMGWRFNCKSAISILLELKPLCVGVNECTLNTTLWIWATFFLCSCHSGVMYSKIRLHGFIFFSNTGHKSWLVKSMWPLCSLALWSGLAYAESAFLLPILEFPSLLVHCPDAHQWASSSPSEWSCDSCLPGFSTPTPPCLKPSQRFGSQCLA